MFPELVDEFLRLRDDFMGSKEEMENHPGMFTKDGGTSFIPTYFERLGQNSVKSNRCYSTSMTHQRPRSLVGPTAGSKAHDDVTLDENLTLRKRVLEVRAIQQVGRFYADNQKVKFKGCYDCIERPPPQRRSRYARRELPGQ